MLLKSSHLWSLCLLVWTPQITAQSVASTACATGVHAIFSRGQGQGDDMDVLSTISDLILQNIPGSTSIGLPYPHGSYDMIGAVETGADLIQEYIQQYVASCPDSKIFILGYSLGAITVMDGICGTSSLLLPVQAAESTQYLNNIIGIVAYGDLTHSPNAPWNVGTCPGGIGILPRLKPWLCDPYADLIRSYCDQGDKMCCNILAPGNNEPHLLYFKNYNADVLSWLQGRLAAAAQSSEKSVDEKDTAAASVGFWWW